VRRWATWIDVASVMLASAWIVALLIRFAVRAPELHEPALAVGFIAGFTAADVVSGVVHWFCDRYSHPRARLIGPILIAPFREHHRDPAALARHGLLECNGNNCLAATPLLVLAWWSLAPPTGRDALTALQTGVASGLALTLCASNQVHAWAHAPNPPRLVRALQRAQVLLAPEHHAVHHRGGRAYAVVCGWSNAWLDVVLPRVERVLTALGARPGPQ
jgi:plasmanylethanolamine desaturase